MFQGDTTALHLDGEVVTHVGAFIKMCTGPRRLEGSRARVALPSPPGAQRQTVAPAEVPPVMFGHYHFRVTKVCGQDEDSQGLERLCTTRLSASTARCRRSRRWRDHPGGSRMRDLPETRQREGVSPSRQPSTRVHFHGPAASLLFQKSRESGRLRLIMKLFPRKLY